jgi:glycosyltransferase involved in cell wall biosynthesis
MIKKVRLLLVNFIQWVIYNLLGSKQKRFLAKLITPKQKRYIKSLLKQGKKTQRLKVVEGIKYKMRSLGFEEKAVEDLNNIIKSTDDNFIKRYAALELAVWFANQQTEEGAKKSLEYIPIALEGENDPEKIRQLTILSAECLMAVGDVEKAKHHLLKNLDVEKHPDVFLALANTETEVSKKVELINEVFKLSNLNPIHINEGEGGLYDRLDCLSKAGQFKNNDETPKVTVIMPVYNAEDVIHTSLKSVLSQTWRNIEVIIVDDCSQDTTLQIAHMYEKNDDRIKVLNMEVNGGAYIARNEALKIATGDYITINDADDWSHPQKIEKQVLHLINNQTIIGNTSQQARLTNELNFYRRGKPGLYIFSNMSSFMFRKVPVMEKLGYWDSVRFAGDSEFINRIKKVFGEKSIVELHSGPLSFQRQSETSLTGNSSFGFPGFFMGVRKEYLEAQKHFHLNNDSLYYSYPQVKRPFNIPNPLLPERRKKNDKPRHFDVIIASDFRLDGGSTLSSVEEIKAQHQAGLKTGIVQLNRYDYSAKKKLNSNIRELINTDAAELIVYGEEVTCDLLLLRYPPIFEEYQIYYPNIQAADIKLIVNQTPYSEYSSNGEKRYSLQRVNNRIKQYFGKEATWYPIGPLVREALLEHHFNELDNIQLAKENWENIININDWNRKTNYHLNKPYIIGRHSRDNYVKWPESPAKLLSAYPSDSNYTIKVLGGATVPKSILGEIPNNWDVYFFDEITSKAFLTELDFFVYYTHSSWIESFGRVIIEAMASGIPVIISPDYKKLFEDAAVYAVPEDVTKKIDFLLTGENYETQVNKGIEMVKERFSYETHIERINKSTKS